jgi:hypothetical protein
MGTCSNCGAPRGDESSECPSCGLPLAESPSTTTPVLPSPWSSKPRGSQDASGPASGVAGRVPRRRVDVGATQTSTDPPWVSASDAASAVRKGPPAPPGGPPAGPPPPTALPSTDPRPSRPQ